jgi:hypothetical protein
VHDLDARTLQLVPQRHAEVRQPQHFPAARVVILHLGQRLDQLDRPALRLAGDVPQVVEQGF